MTRALGGPGGPWTHRFAAVNGVRLHYVRQGAGFPAILLHGWPGFWYDWARVIPPLARHHDVVAPDLRGFGYSGKPALPPAEGYSLETAARDIAGLARHLGFERVALVAYDIGSAVAPLIAREFPELVARLVLLGPGYPGIGRRWREPGHVHETWYQLFHLWPLAEELVGVSRAALRVYLRHFLRHWSHRKAWVTARELDRYVAAYARPGALRGGFSYYRAREARRTTEADLPAARFRVATPTLVLWPGADPVRPLAWTDRLPEYFPSLTLTRVPGVGHFMMREAPARVVREILAFLAPLRPRVGRGGGGG